MLKPFRYVWEAISIMYSCEAKLAVKIVCTPVIVVLALMIGILNIGTKDTIDHREQEAKR